MLISASLIAAKAVLLVVMAAFAGRAALRLVLGNRFNAATDWFSATSAGVVVLYIAGILTRRPDLAFAGLAIFAAGGAWIYLGERAQPVPPASAQTAWWEAVLAVLMVMATLAIPLTEWDARSIWFYHAKIFFHDGLDAQTWRYVAGETRWSHPYYPKLLPVVAGTTAWLFGFWNDYLPKLALAIVAVPAMLLGGRLFDDWRGRALFWALVFSVVRRFMWNGYMDGLLAVWSTVALLYVLAGCLGAISAERAILVSALALSICVGLKVEGWVIVASFAGGLIIVYGARWRSLRSDWGGYARACGLVLAPYMLWRLYCYQVGLGEGWATLSTDYLGRALSRLSSIATLSEISGQMFRRTIVLTLVLLGAVMFVLRAAGTAWRSASAAVLLIIAFYWLALFFVYLGTPIDVGYHLQTSVSRTVLPPRTWILALLVAAYMVWRGAWRPQAP